jgi:hypothetical protein
MAWGEKYFRSDLTGLCMCVFSAATTKGENASERQRERERYDHDSRQNILHSDVFCPPFFFFLLFNTTKLDISRR